MKYFLLAIALASGLSLWAQKSNTYPVVATYHIGSTGGWDYIAEHEGKLYIAHGTQVNILNENTGDSVGVILHTQGVHGVAFCDALARGYTSNGRTNDVTVFDLKTNAVVTQVSTGENPDAILYDPFTQRIITCNGRSNNISLIDPATNKTVATIAVGGRPETAVSNEKGLLYVNIEDKNEIVAVDLKSKSVVQHWPLHGGEGPTGLSYDAATARLFAGCEKQLIVLDANNGKLVAKLPIGNGCDGVVFDPKTKIIFTANGADGNITAIKEVNANEFTVLGSYPTKRSGRTIALDNKTGRLFIPAADFEKSETNNGRPAVVPGSFQVLVVSTRH